MTTDALLAPVEKANMIIALLGLWIIINPILTGQPSQGSLEFYGLVIPAVLVVILSAFAVRGIRNY